MTKLWLIALLVLASCCAPQPLGGKQGHGFKIGEWVKFKRDGRRGFIMAGPRCVENTVQCDYQVWLDDYADPVWLNEGTLEEGDR